MSFQIRVSKEIENQTFKVRIATEEFSQDDEDLLIEFGEPEVDLGGDFTGPPAYTLANNLAKIKSESPFVQSFDGRDEVSDAVAQSKADVWATEVVARIKTEMTTLRANANTFNDESLETF
jgi:hypothetical protein